MKIRHHRKHEYWFYPSNDSKFYGERCKIFKRKSSLMKFLNSNLDDVINGTVILHESCFGSSYTVREWFVWLNDYDYRFKRKEPKIVLKQMLFRGRKYVSRKRKVSSRDKKYFAFSEKVINLMCKISDVGINENNTKKLKELFKKRGFIDFEPIGDDLEYINYYLEKGIDFFHWSDRCNWLRTKTILEYFKKQGY